MLFVIFDIEIIFMIPWPWFQSLGLLGFVEMLLFLGILLVGFWYAGRRGVRMGLDGREAWSTSARRARTIRMCSLDARNGSRPGHPSQSMRGEREENKNR
jgi:hypothetical protein